VLLLVVSDAWRRRFRQSQHGMPAERIAPKLSMTQSSWAPVPPGAFRLIIKCGPLDVRSQVARRGRHPRFCFLHGGQQCTHSIAQAHDRWAGDVTQPGPAGDRDDRRDEWDCGTLKPRTPSDRSRGIALRRASSRQRYERQIGNTGWRRLLPARGGVLNGRRRVSLSLVRHVIWLLHSSTYARSGEESQIARACQSCPP
jgi:hypothetical protein